MRVVKIDDVDEIADSSEVLDCRQYSTTDARAV